MWGWGRWEEASSYPIYRWKGAKCVRNSTCLRRKKYKRLQTSLKMGFPVQKEKGKGVGVGVREVLDASAIQLLCVSKDLGSEATGKKRACV